jgi:cytochrome c
MKYLCLAALLVSVGAGVVPAANAAGDPAKGAKVFQEECGDCHSSNAGKNKKGPALAGVIGRKAATAPDFNYSDGMKASGIVWAAETIDPYITRPKKVVPEGKMKYDGLKDEQARADVISYLMSLH